jgi:hypothetical protein
LSYSSIRQVAALQVDNRKLTRIEDAFQE